MKRSWRVQILGSGVILLLVLLTAACLGQTTPELAPTTLPNPTPTPVEIIPAILEAIQTEVKLHRSEDSDVIQPKTTIEILKDDRISVSETGQAVLTYADGLKIELYDNTEIGIDDVQLVAEQGSVLLRLLQVAGHSRIDLAREANIRLELNTEIVHITPTTPENAATTFLVCHAPETVTCIATLEGELVVSAQDEEIRVPAGMSTFIFFGEPPGQPVCMDMAEFNHWFAAKRRGDTPEALGDLVGRWLENDPCLDGTAVPLPSSLPTRDGMVQIPAGQYEVGHPVADEFHLSNTQIELPAFWIDTFEVNNNDYLAFVNQTGHAAPVGWIGNIFQPGREAHPVSGVTWNDAQAYCNWVQKRLPHEAEWEVSARGPESPPPLYPWGNETSFAELEQLSRVDTYPVGTAPFNRSLFGVHDMAMNVWEWVDAPYGPLTDENNKLLRGGRYGFLRDMAYRQEDAADNPRYVELAGFRCAADRVEGE